MISKKSRLSFIFTVVALVSFSSVTVFATEYIQTNSISGGTTVKEKKDHDRFIPKASTRNLDLIKFVSTNLTKIGTNTATFKYKVVDGNDRDITKTIAISQVSPIVSLPSTVVLNPLTGIGTVTFKDSSDTDKPVIVTLIDLVTGRSVMLNTGVPEVAEPVISIPNSAVAKIEFPSNEVTKIGTNTATFQYRLMDKQGVDITKTIPASEIISVESVNSTISLNPSTGTGTITYNSSNDVDKAIEVVLTDSINGLTAVLNTGTTDDSVVSVIEFDSNKLTKTGTTMSTFKYKVLNKSYIDITKVLSTSEIIATSSTGSTITLDPSTGTGTIIYNSSNDVDKPIVISLVDGLTNTTVTSTMYISKPVTESPKISEIAIPSTQLGLDNVGNGYATYTVHDQYGNDISCSSLAEKLIFKSNVGTIQNHNGIIMLTPNAGINLSTLKSVLITCNDPITGVSTSATVGITP